MSIIRILSGFPENRMLNLVFTAFLDKNGGFSLHCKSTYSEENQNQSQLYWPRLWMPKKGLTHVHSLSPSTSPLIHATPRQGRIIQSHAEAKKNTHGVAQNDHHQCTCMCAQLSVIDGERHKGQQSAGLRLDRTRLLLHHLDSGDGADPN